MPNTFHGCCPICGIQLLLDDDHPGTVVCPNNHYVCQADDFNRLWDEFGAQVKQLGVDKASTAYVKQLLKLLRALNTIQEAHYGTRQS